MPLGARATEVGMRVIDATVDDCDTNTVAASAQSVRGRGADVGYGFSEIDLVIGNADHARDRRVRGKRGQVGGIDVEHHCVQREPKRGDDIRWTERATARAR